MLQPLEERITNFCSSLIVSEVDESLRQWTGLSIKSGGVSIPSPTRVSSLNNRISAVQCSHLLNFIKRWDDFDHAFHQRVVAQARA